MLVDVISLKNFMSSVIFHVYEIIVPELTDDWSIKSYGAFKQAGGVENAAIGIGLTVTSFDAVD